MDEQLKKNETSKRNKVSAYSKSQPKTSPEPLPLLSKLKVGILSLIIVGYAAWEASWSRFGLGRVPGFTFGGGEPGSLFAGESFYYPRYTLFLIVVLYSLSKLFTKFFKKSLLTRRELGLLMIIIIVGGLVIQMAGLYGVTVLTSGFLRLATTIFQPWVMEWMSKLGSNVMPMDFSAIERFAMGGDVPWSHWIMPITTLTVFMMLLFWLQICIGAMLRRHWNDVQHFQYPLTEAPLAILDSHEGMLIDATAVQSIWKSGVGWLGIALGMGIILAWKLNEIFPAIPSAFPETRFLINRERVNIFGQSSLGVGIHPVAIAVAYLLMNVYILFSVWFMTLVMNWGVFFLYDSMGLMHIGRFNVGYRFEQLLGISLTMAAFSVYYARDQLKIVFQSAIGNKGDNDDSNEPLPYPLAFWGFCAGIIAIAVFASVLYNIQVLFALAWIIIFISLSITLGRMRAQAGHFVNNTQFEFIFVGRGIPYFVTGSQIVNKETFVFSHAFLGPRTSNIDPLILGISHEAYKMGDAFNLPRRTITKSLLAIAIIAIVLTFTITVASIHHHGGVRYSDGYAAIVIENQHIPESFMANPERGIIPPFQDRYGLTFILIGIGMTAALSYLSTMFLWWPIHPLGYAVAMTRYVPQYGLWFPFLIAWFLKVVIMRYGGRKVDKNIMRPFMLSLIVGCMITWPILAVLRLIFG